MSCTGTGLYRLIVMGFAGLVVAFSALAGEEPATIRYVSEPTGDDMNSGSEGSPYRSISGALAAMGLEGAATPWLLNIGPGTYDESVETFPIVLASGGVQLVGTGDRDDTVIDGGEGTVETAANALIFGDGITDFRIAGLTFRDAARTGGTDNGGAVELINSSGVIEDCAFTDNSSERAGGALWISVTPGAQLRLLNNDFTGNEAGKSGTFQDRIGGAVCVAGAMEGEVIGNTFTSNSAALRFSGSGTANAFGGALYIGGFTGTNGASSFSGNVFSGNSVSTVDGDGSLGAAVVVEGAFMGGLDACSFTGNTAPTVSTDGTFVVTGSFTGNLSGTEFVDNIVRGSGAGILIGSDFRGDITGCTFDGNQAGANDSTFQQMTGGAIAILGDFAANLTGLSDCTFIDNSAVMGAQGSGSAQARGGAVHVGGNWSGPLRENTFLNCTANSVRGDSYGGGLFVGGEFNREAIEGTIEGNVFKGCTATGTMENSAGGGLFIAGAVTASITGNRFESNLSELWGGGASLADTVVGNIEDNDFVGNSLSTNLAKNLAGGGLHIALGLSGAVSNNRFFRNTADMSRQGSGTFTTSGGGMYVGGTFGGKLSGNEFVGNRVTCDDGSAYGGGLFVLGEVARNFVEENLFSGNHADSGGGLYLTFEGGDNVFFRSNLFTANTCTDLLGADIASEQRVTLINNTFSGNSDAGASIYFPTIAAENRSALYNNLFENVETAVHLASAIAIPMANNNFRANTAILRRNGISYTDLGEIAELFGGQFAGNTTLSNGLAGNGDANGNDEATGSWKAAAKYEVLTGFTTLSDTDRDWTPGEWRGAMVDLSNDQFTREHYRIADNTATTLLVEGNVEAAVRGGLLEFYSIDDFHLVASSLMVDRGASVISDAVDVTPTQDFDGEGRPVGCGIDIGADEYQGNPTCLGNLEVSPSSIEFSGQVAGSGPSAPRAVTIQNTGLGNLGITGIALSDSSDSFAISADSGEAVLSPDAIRTVMLVFDPMLEGAFEGVLEIISNDPDTPKASVALSGTATAAVGGPIADFSADTLTGEAPLRVQFTDESDLGGGTLVSRNWDFGDGTTSSEEHPQHTYENSGTFTVSLTVTTNAGEDIESKADFITVDDAATDTPIAEFSADVTSGGRPLAVQFTNESDLRGGVLQQLRWDFGDGNSSDEEHPQHTYEAAGTFTVSLVVTTDAGESAKVKDAYIVVAGGDCVIPESLGGVVHVSQTMGDDLTGDGSADAPWRTIAFAMARASDCAGSGSITIQLAPGDYEEKVVFAPDVILRGASPETTRVFPKEEEALGGLAVGDSVILASEGVSGQNELHDLTIQIAAGAPSNVALLRVNDTEVQASNIIFNGMNRPGSIAVDISSEGSSMSEFSQCLFSRVDFGVFAIETEANFTRSRFEDIRESAVFVRHTGAAEAAQFPVLGIDGDAQRTALNTFNMRNIAGGTGLVIDTGITADTAAIPDLFAEQNSWEGAADDAEIVRRNSANVKTGAKLGGGGLLNVATLAVRVIDQSGGTPVENAILSLGVGSIPDQNVGVDGNYVFLLIPQGTYVVTAQAAGYAQGSKTVNADDFIVFDTIRLQAENGLSTDQIMQLLLNDFDAVDTNSDGRLSFSEAIGAIPSLTQEVFEQIDLDRNGNLTREELGADVCTVGCCPDTMRNLIESAQKSMGDLFLLGLSALLLWVGRWGCSGRTDLRE